MPIVTRVWQKLQWSLHPHHQLHMKTGIYLENSNCCINFECTAWLTCWWAAGRLCPRTWHLVFSFSMPQSAGWHFISWSHQSIPSSRSAGDCYVPEVPPQMLTECRQVTGWHLLPTSTAEWCYSPMKHDVPVSQWPLVHMTSMLVHPKMVTLVNFMGIPQDTLQGLCSSNISHYWGQGEWEWT